ncbi:MAG TPA: hypothetical protein VLE70_14405 [Anaerolineae bacterium]|nr:hypothetical protein [Anaerolineae bacterium]
MRQYSAEEAMEISNKITGVTSLLIGAVVAFGIGIILVKLLWAWTIPDLLPTAVDQGLIVDDLTWLAAMKIVVLVAILVSTSSLVTGRWGQTVQRRC